MVAECEPSEEITGGTWFSGGSLDTEVIIDVKKRCKKQIITFEATSANMIWKGRKKSDTNLIYTTQQNRDILEALVLDKEVEEVTNLEMCQLVRFVIVLYGEAADTCDVCLCLRDCTHDGVISPKNCEHLYEMVS